MGPTRKVYTKSDLLALAPLAAKLSLSSEALAKFDVIEVGDPAPAPKRREVDREAAASSNSNANGAANAGSNNGNGNHNVHPSSSGNHGSSSGGRGDRGERRGGNSDSRDEARRQQQQHLNERFAPPPRSWRGNRDDEAFVEGFKYELEQNAAHQKRLQDTMQREERKLEREETRPPPVEEPQPAEEPPAEDNKESDVIEQLLAGITTAEETKGPTTRRSRFFTESHTPAAPTAAEPPTTTAAASAWKPPANPVPEPPVWEGSNTANSGAGNGSGFATAGGNIVVGGVIQSAIRIPTASGVAHLPTAALPANQPSAKAEGRGGAKPQVWQAQDLEKLLKSAPRRQQPHPAKQPEPSVLSKLMPPPPTATPTQPDMSKYIQVTDPDHVSMLLGRRTSYGKATNNVSQPPSGGNRTPPQQLPNNLPSRLAPMQMSLPPQWLQLAQQQAQHPQPQPQPPGAAAQGIALQAAMQQPHPQAAMPPGGMQVPMMMNAQGQYFAAPAQTYFMQGQPMLCRRPDGSIVMQSPINTFPTNADFLFQQQQAQQQLRR